MHLPIFVEQTGDLKIEAEGEKILKLPAGGKNQHWTRNIITNRDGSKIYIAVGSKDNIGENGRKFLPAAPVSLK